jgi:hypothetical protein
MEKGTWICGWCKQKVSSDKDHNCFCAECKDKDREIEELKGLLCEAAPLAWVFNDDAKGARQWEIKVAKVLKLKGGDAS